MIVANIKIWKSHLNIREGSWIIIQVNNSYLPSESIYLLSDNEMSCAVGDVRALLPPRKAEWSLSGEPKATGNTFLLLSFYLLVFLSHRILICLFFLISY